MGEELEMFSRLQQKGFSFETRYCMPSNAPRNSYLGRRGNLCNVFFHRQVRVARYFSGEKILSLPPIRFSDRLLAQAKDIGLQIIEHPFHNEIVSGTLCKERFEIYIKQDGQYIERCIEILKKAQARFPQQWNLFELLLIDTRVGLEQNKEFQIHFKIDTYHNQMNKACEEYIEFLTNVAEKGELMEIIGALWPCYSVFIDMYRIYTKEMNLSTREHPYYELMKSYKEMEDLKSVEGMKRLLDDVLVDAKVAEKGRLKKVFFRSFYNSLEYERRFYDAIYEVDKKISNVPKIINSITSIKEKLLAMPQGSWVLWDLDDTVWISDLPVLRMINNPLLENYIASLESDYPNIRAIVWELYYRCNYRLIEEEDIKELFSALKKKNIHVLGLTKRETGHPTINELKMELTRQDLTLRQLDKLDLLFSPIFPEGEILLEQAGTNPAILKRGVAFTSGLDKGDILREVLQKAVELGIPLPTEIAFFDDLYENIRSVEAMFQKNSEYNIPVSVVHYRGSDVLFDDEKIDYEALNCNIQALLHKSN